MVSVCDTTNIDSDHQHPAHLAWYVADFEVLFNKPGIRNHDWTSHKCRCMPMKRLVVCHSEMYRELGRLTHQTPIKDNR